MLSVFLNRKGDVILTLPDVDMQQGNRVKFDNKIYYVVQRTLNVRGGFLEVLLYESAETE